MGMSFTDAIRTCLRKYVTFSGRASRPEFWYFFLFNLMLTMIAAALDSVVFSTATSGSELFQTVVSLGLFLPYLAAAFRRMHDTGRSGWFVLLPTFLALSAVGVLIFGIGFAGMFAHGGSMDTLLTRATLLVLIPTLVILVLSPILVLFWLSHPSEAGENRYGPHPGEVPT